MSLEKDESQQAEGKEQAASATETEKKFTQDDINRIVAKESKKWEKEQAEVFKKASEFDKLQDEIKKQKEAELTETERLKEEKKELEKFKTVAEELEMTLSEYLATELERIPEDMLSLIPDELTVRGKLSYISKNRDKLIPKTQQVQSPGAARATNGVSVDRSSIEVQAEEALLKVGLTKDNPLWNHTLRMTVEQMRNTR